jgi:hypothetical protein
MAAFPVSTHPRKIRRVFLETSTSLGNRKPLGILNV